MTSMVDRVQHSWTYAVQNAKFQWHSSSFESFLALFVIYFVWHYPWGYQNQDRLLQPSKHDYQKKRRSAGSGSSITTSDTATASLDDTVVDTEDALAKRCPSSTWAERKRFLKARQHNLAAATKMLQHYLQWHQKYIDVAMEHNITRTVTEDGDLDIWNEACQVAMKACGEDGEGPLPRVIRTHLQSKDPSKPLVDKSGYRLVQIIPAQMDITLAKSSTYALAVALYLNLQLDREAEERIVVCMDVRAGQGWPNTHAVRLVPFMQQTTTLLLSLFPERLHRCLLYPVPTSFTWVWKTISKVVDPLTREKICLMSGPNKIASPPPFKTMYDCMDKDTAHQLEHERIAAFL
jgi:CRAL/TRIO domain